MSNGICVLVIDDHALLGDALKEVLGRATGIERVDVFTSLAAALDAPAEPPPDVVVFDYSLGEADLITNVRQLERVYPKAATLVFTGQEESAALAEAVQSGCRGFVLKSQPLADLVAAIRIVHEGGAVVPAHLLRMAVREPPSSQPDRGLTPREVEVLQRLVDGARLSQIAEDLAISPNTVRNHVQRLLRKLDAHSQREAVATALREGLVP